MLERIAERLDLWAPFHADRLGNDRGVAVYLPASYESNPKECYPVLYLQDGLSCYDCDPRKPNEPKAGVDSWTNKLSERGDIREVILVAVDSVAGRDQEFSPEILGNDYADFIVRQVKPCIDQHYRTLNHPSDTAVAGWSLGALISLFLAWKHPDTFGNAACLSTCFYDCPTQQDRDMRLATFNDMILSRDFSPDLRLYLDYGTAESVPDDISQPENIEQTRRLTLTLQENLLIPGEDYLFHIETGGRHEMVAWRRRFFRPLRFLFPVPSAS